MSNHSDHAWSGRQKSRLIRRYGLVCQHCKERFTRDELEVDHIDGYSWHRYFANLQLLCKDCHRAKTHQERGWGAPGRSKAGIQLLIEQGYEFNFLYPGKPHISLRETAREVGVSHATLLRAWKRHLRDNRQEAEQRLLAHKEGAFYQAYKARQAATRARIIQNLSQERGNQ